MKLSHVLQSQNSTTNMLYCKRFNQAPYRDFKATNKVTLQSKGNSPWPPAQIFDFEEKLQYRLTLLLLAFFMVLASILSHFQAFKLQKSCSFWGFRLMFILHHSHTTKSCCTLLGPHYLESPLL